jgi:mono/diheme cytochrome c family protein
MRAAWIAIVVGAAAACNGSVAGGAKDGAAVFAQACATCHGPTGAPSADMAAKLGVRDLTTPEFHARVTKELVAHQVRTGSSNHIMPSFDGALTDAQIDAVAAYVLTLSTPHR